VIGGASGGPDPALVDSDRDAEHRLGRILRLVVWGHMPVIAAWAALSTAFHPAGAPRRLTQLAVLAIVFGIVLHIERTGRVRAASAFLVAASWVLIAVAVLLVGEIGSPSWFLFSIVIVEAGLFLGGRAAAVTIAASAAVGVVVLVLTQHGLIAPRVTSTPVMWWIAGVVVFGLVGMLQQASARLYRSSLDRARDELAARRLAQEAREAADRRHRAMFQAAPAGLLDLDLHALGRWVDARGLAGKPDEALRWTSEQPGALAEVAALVSVRDANDAALRILGVPSVAGLNAPTTGQPPNPHATALLVRAVAGTDTWVQRDMEIDTAAGKRWVVASLALPADRRTLDHVVLGLLDITEQRQLEEQVRAAQRLETVGLLAGGVAHDFNNLLTIVRMNADRMQRRLAPGADGRRELEMMLDAVSRGAALTRQLLLFSRRQVTRREKVSVNDVLSALETLLHRLVGEPVRLALELDLACGPVEMDPSQLEQIIMNLAVNARDAMPDGGTLRIATRRLDDGDGGVAIQVVDSGQGMDAATRARAFEPFFTTKPPGQGSGLGLATVYGIAKQSGGSVAIESAIGRGTTIEVRLPAASPSAEISETALPIASDGADSGGHILLVEDEGAVRDVTRAVLESAGYQVTAVGDGAEALTRSGKADLVVSDLVMPGMSGRELVTRLRAARPSLPVVFVSGYAAEGDPTPSAGEGTTEFLAKPFTADQLLARVRSALDIVRRAGA
jgi:signal transduction histidine kinase/CheY-like chemotaxis protein